MRYLLILLLFISCNFSQERPKVGDCFVLKCFSEFSETCDYNYNRVVKVGNKEFLYVYYKRKDILGWETTLKNVEYISDWKYYQLVNEKYCIEEGF